MKYYIPILLLLSSLATATGCVSRQINRTPNLAESRCGRPTIEEHRFIWIWQSEFWR